MADDTDTLAARDLAGGVPLRALVEGVPLVGHVDGQAVLRVRSRGQLRAFATAGRTGGPSRAHA